MLELLSPETFAVAGMAGASVRYWVRNERRPAEPVIEEPEPFVPWGQLVWDRYIGCQGGLLPGAQLVDLHEFLDGRDGWEATIVPAPGGRQTPDSIRAATANITAAYDLPPGSVDITPRGARAHMVVMREHVLFTPCYWLGPTLDPLTGLAIAGRYVDGVKSYLRYFSPGSGATHWLVFGAPGSGKTYFLQGMLMETALATFTDQHGQVRPLFETCLGDGKGGSSFPEWRDSPSMVHYAETYLDIERMLEAQVREMEWRKRHMARVEWVDGKGRTRRGLSFFDPVKAGLPYRQVVIDEFPLVRKARPRVVDLVLQLAQGGRGLGIRVVICAQSISATELGGGTDLRGMIAGTGNVIAFRTTDRNQKGMGFAEGLGGANPSTLPTTMPDGVTPLQGMSYLSGPDGRDAMHRSLSLPDPYDVAVSAPAPVLHPKSRLAGGYELWAWKGRLLGTIADEDPIPRGPARPDPQEAVLPLLWGEQPVADAPPADDETAGQSTGPRAVPDAVPAGLDGGNADQVRRWRALLEAIGEGPTERKDVIERCKHLGVSMRTQTNDLDELQRRGLIHTVGGKRGVFARGRGPAAAA